MLLGWASCGLTKYWIKFASELNTSQNHALLAHIQPILSIAQQPPVVNHWTSPRGGKSRDVHSCWREMCVCTVDGRSTHEPCHAWLLVQMRMQSGSEMPLWHRIPQSTVKRRNLRSRRWNKCNEPPYAECPLSIACRNDVKSSNKSSHWLQFAPCVSQWGMWRMPNNVFRE